MGHYHTKVDHFLITGLFHLSHSNLQIFTFFNLLNVFMFLSIYSYISVSVITYFIVAINSCSSIVDLKHLLTQTLPHEVVT